MKKTFHFCLLFVLVVVMASSAGAYSSPSLTSNEYVRVGKDYYRKKDFDRAIEEFNKALLADPVNEEALLYLRILGYGMEEKQPSSVNRQQREQGVSPESPMDTDDIDFDEDVVSLPVDQRKALEKFREQAELEKQIAIEKFRAQAVQDEKAEIQKLRQQYELQEQTILDETKPDKTKLGETKPVLTTKKKSAKEKTKKHVVKKLEKQKNKSKKQEKLKKGQNLPPVHESMKEEPQAAVSHESDDPFFDLEKIEPAQKSEVESPVTTPVDNSFKQTKAALAQTPVATTTTSVKKVNINAGLKKSAVPENKSDVEFVPEPVAQEETDIEAVPVTEEKVPEAEKVSSQKAKKELTKKEKYHVAKLRAEAAQKEKEVLDKMQKEKIVKERRLRQKLAVDLQKKERQAFAQLSEGHGDLDQESTSASSENSNVSTMKPLARHAVNVSEIETQNAALRRELADVIAMSQKDQELIKKLQSGQNVPDQVVMAASAAPTSSPPAGANNAEDIKAQRSFIKDESAKIKTLQARVNALEDELHSKKFKFDDKQLDYEKKIQDLEREVGDYKFAKAKSEDEYQDQLKTLKDALEKKIKELNDAEERLLFLDYKLKKKEKQYATKNGQYDELKKTLTDLEGRLSGLQNQMQDDETKMMEVVPGQLPTPKTREEEVYQRWIQRHDKLVTRLKQKLLWAREQMDFLGSYDIKLSDQKMAILKEELAKAKKQLNEKNLGIGNRPENYELVEERLKDTQQRLEMVEKILKEKDEQIQELEKQLNGALSAIQ